MVEMPGTSVRRLRAKLSAFLVKYDTPLGIGFLVGLCGLWFVFAIQQEATYPKLHAVGIRDWAVTCEGGGRTYRLESGNVSGYRSGLSVIQRSLSLFNDAGEELYYTQRFEPEAYERTCGMVFPGRVGQSALRSLGGGPARSCTATRNALKLPVPSMS